MMMKKSSLIKEIFERLFRVTVQFGLLTCAFFLLSRHFEFIPIITLSEASTLALIFWSSTTLVIDFHE